MTNDQAIEYAAAVQTLEPLGVSLTTAVSIFAEAFKITGDPATVITAAKSYVARHKKVKPRRVALVVADLITTKKSRGASPRYLGDLRSRLNKFAESFPKDLCNVTTPDIQGWLDAQKLSTQSYENNRRVIHLLFKFAVSSGYAHENPVAGVDSVKVKNRATQIFTPEEITRLLAAASAEFLPCLAIGAFAGLRSAEIERLEWSDVDLQQRHITVGADKAKTASRRIVPIPKNLAQWLADYAERKGKVWTGGWLYKAQQDCAAATEIVGEEVKGVRVEKAVKWKQNALRHSYASYRLAQTQNAAQVALECGNSAQMVFRHYRELVTASDAKSWFGIRPEGPDNLVSLSRKEAHG